jgi:hypothetical protein
LASLGNFIPGANSLRSFKKVPPPKERVSARAPAPPTLVVKKILTKNWLEKLPPRPWIYGIKRPEEDIPRRPEGADTTVEKKTEDPDEGPGNEEKPGILSYAFFRKEKVRKVDDKSLSKIREIMKSRLGSLVIRRIKIITPSSKGKYKHVFHSPETHRTISQEEFDQLDDYTKASRTESFFEGNYSFVTSEKDALPSHDKLKGQPIYGDHLGRAEFDPVSLKLEPAKNRPMPRVSNGKNQDQEEPASLVIGVVTQDHHTGKFMFKYWAIISVQEQRAIVELLEPDVIHPTRKGEFKTDEDAYRVWLLGAGRLQTNAARRRILSTEKSKSPKGALRGGMTKEEKEKIYTRYVGSECGLHHCHIFSFWVLLARYGELPEKGNIPTVVPATRPKDPEKAKKFYRDVPLPWWDLPYLNNKKLSDIIAEKYELKWAMKEVNIPVHERVAWPARYYTEPPTELKKQEGQNDVALLVVLPPPRSDTPRPEEHEVPEKGERTKAPSRSKTPSRSRTPSRTRSSSPHDSDVDDSIETLGSSAETPVEPYSSDSDTDVRSETPEVVEEVVETVIEPEIFGFTRPRDWGSLVEEDPEIMNMDFDAPLVLDSSK